MTLIVIIFLLVIVGIFLNYIDMDAKVKSLIIAVLAVVLLAWALSYLGVMPHGRLK